MIRRLKAYKKISVDVLFFEGPQSRKELKAVRSEVEGPLMATLNVLDSHPTPEEQQKMGLAVAFYPRLMVQGMFVGGWDYNKDFKERGVEALKDFDRKYKDYPLYGLGHFGLVGFPEIHRLEQKSLPQSTLEKYQKPSSTYDPTARPQSPR
jgi:2-methylisocitrate lyase-like PEP mutase family enzyme